MYKNVILNVSQMIYNIASKGFEPSFMKKLWIIQTELMWERNQDQDQLSLIIFIEVPT